MDYQPPADLSEKAQAIWRGIVPRRAKTAERMLLIETALQALDRADQVSIEIKKEGLTIENPSTGAIRANPLIKLEKELRAQFATIWDKAGLDWDAVIDGGNEPAGLNWGSKENREKTRQAFDQDITTNNEAVKNYLK